MAIHSIIFDLGGVLVDWNPRYLYRKLLPDEASVTHFLTHIATNDWNEAQDEGRSLAAGTAALVAEYPAQRELIEAFYGRWEEMLAGPIAETVDILKYFRDHPDYNIFALTNWSAETFPIAQARYDFLSWFEGILVSGEEKIRKPDPAFYQLLEKRFPLRLKTSLFIDDNARNVAAAEKLGLRSIHFEHPTQLRQALEGLGLYA